MKRYDTCLRYHKKSEIQSIFLFENYNIINENIIKKKLLLHFWMYKKYICNKNFDKNQIYLISTNKIGEINFDSINEEILKQLDNIYINYLKLKINKFIDKYESNIKNNIKNTGKICEELKKYILKFFKKDDFESYQEFENKLNNYYQKYYNINIIN